MSHESSSVTSMSTSISSEPEQNRDFNLCLIPIITKLLNNIILSSSPNQFTHTNLFSLDSIPSISLSDYLNRIILYTNIESSTLISSLIYIDRFCSNGCIKISHYNIHTILFISLYLAIKYNEDNLYDDVYYAKVGGLPLSEVTQLSLVFMTIIGYKLYIDNEEYKIYENYIIGDYLENYFCYNNITSLH